MRFCGLRFSFLPLRLGTDDASNLSLLRREDKQRQRDVTPLLRAVYEPSQVLDLARRELPPPAGLETVERQAGVDGAVESADRQADGREHPLDLMLAALVEHELDAAASQAARPSRRRRPVVQLD